MRFSLRFEIWDFTIRQSSNEFNCYRIEQTWFVFTSQLNVEVQNHYITLSSICVWLVLSHSTTMYYISLIFCPNYWLEIFALKHKRVVMSLRCHLDVTLKMILANQHSLGYKNSTYVSEEKSQFFIWHFETCFLIETLTDSCVC